MGSEAPIAYRLRAKDYAEASGVNFAVAGAGVYEAPTLAKQIYYFRKMVEDGTVTRNGSSRIPSRSSPSPATITRACPIPAPTIK